MSYKSSIQIFKDHMAAQKQVHIGKITKSNKISNCQVQENLQTPIMHLNVGDEISFTSIKTINQREKNLFTMRGCVIKTNKKTNRIIVLIWHPAMQDRIIFNLPINNPNIKITIINQKRFKARKNFNYFLDRPNKIIKQKLLKIQKLATKKHT